MSVKTKKQPAKNIRKLYSRTQRSWQLQNIITRTNNEANKQPSSKTKQSRQSWTINKIENNARLSKSRFNRRHMETEETTRKQNYLKE